MNRKPNCPLCGAPTTYVGLNSIECIGAGCDNYVDPFAGMQTDFKAFARAMNKELAARMPIGPVSITYKVNKTP